MAEIKIADYFKKNPKSLTGVQKAEIQRIRDNINSFKYNEDILEYLRKRRNNYDNVKEDYILFDIPITNTVPEHDKGDNYYYDSKNKFSANENENGKENTQRKPTDINKPKRYSLDNFKRNISNSKIGKVGKFIARHLKGCLIAAGIILAAIIIFIAAIYTYGIVNSMGQSPFTLCGEGGVSNASFTSNISDENTEEMTKPEYVANAFIQVAKSKGWKKEAIIGTLSYMLQEGSGYGFFSYEGWYCWKGPGGTTYDRTLNNQAWLKWLPNEGKEQAHNGYYAANTTHYAAIGIGLTQESDVWEYNGSMEDTGATELITYAEEHGKPWQDPATQLEYLFDTIFTTGHAFDENQNPPADPKVNDYSAEIWCRRVTAGVGMPAWVYTNNSKYMQDHTQHLSEAENYYNNYKEGVLKSLGQSTTSNGCEDFSTIASGGNASIADAAVTLAGTLETKITFSGVHGPSDPALKDSRLKQYAQIHQEYLPNDIYYASCDRAAATAILWAGADDSFPAGGTAVQADYLENQDKMTGSEKKWQYVGIGKDMFDNNKLEPGDVLITREGSGHIMIYVGDKTKTRWPDSDANMYAGSYEQYYPRVYTSTLSDPRSYKVYRCLTETSNNSVKTSQAPSITTNPG